MPIASIISACWLSRHLRDQLAELASQWHPNEVGGILAGYVNGGAAVVTEIVGPGSDALHRPSTFLPDHAYHVQEMQRIHAASHGAHGYLGDWHTHPNGAERLSALDKRTLLVIGRDPDAQCPQPVMLLFSGGSVEWRVHAFTLTRPTHFRGRRVIEVHIRLY